MEMWERLAVALAIGLLIGMERGWHERLAAEGTRVAGLRTFALVSLLGGLWGLLAQELGPLLLGFAFTAFVAVLISGQLVHARAQGKEFGITTEVAALITFALGALAARGYTSVAAAVAVVVTLLLGLKPVLHQWLERLEEQELFAVIKLLLISVVLLPVLPDQGFGPGKALNPYHLWWLVVLIAGISFVGYFAMKLAGPRIGLGLTALFGGLTSSTATTLSFSRLGALNQSLQPLLAAGVVVAATTMWVRILLILVLLNQPLAADLLLPLLATGIAGFVAVALLWHSSSTMGKPEELQLTNPFELGPALKFGAFLAIIMLLSKVAQQHAGAAGTYAVAVLSGIADVDAITVSLARMAGSDLTYDEASKGIYLAAVVNTVVKIGMVAVITGGTMARRVTAGLGVAMVLGALLLVFF